MPRTATQTTTKAATRTANNKTKKDATAEPKAKRAPTPYNIFMGEQIKLWKAANPEAPHKDGMKAVAALWKESDQNPKKGQEVKSRKPKADKENTKKPRKNAKTVKEIVEEEEAAEEDEDEE